MRPRPRPEWINNKCACYVNDNHSNIWLSQTKLMTSGLVNDVAVLGFHYSWLYSSGWQLFVTNMKSVHCNERDHEAGLAGQHVESEAVVTRGRGRSRGQFLASRPRPVGGLNIPGVEWLQEVKRFSRPRWYVQLWKYSTDGAAIASTEQSIEHYHCVTDRQTPYNMLRTFIHLFRSKCTKATITVNRQ